MIGGTAIRIQLSMKDGVRFSGSTRGPRLKIGLLVVATLVVGLFILKPLYRLGKGWRARQLSRQAESFIAAGRWEDAVPKARAAYQLMPDEPAALRAVAQLQSDTGEASAATARRALFGRWKMHHSMPVRSLLPNCSASPSP